MTERIGSGYQRMYLIRMICNARVRSGFLFAVLTCGLSLPARGQAAGPAMTFGRIREYWVEILDQKQETWRAIYRGERSWLTELSVAPSGERLAVLSWTRGAVSGHDYSVQPKAELVVIDTGGRTLATVSDVHEYAWCGSDRVAYIQGEYSEDSDNGFRPDGRMGLLEIASGKTTPLRGLRYPVAVAWNPLDRAVYLRDVAESVAVYRVDRTTGTPAHTPLRDLQFSPSGRYYLHWPAESGPDSIQIYETRSNARVDLSSFSHIAQLVGWAGPRGDVLLAVRRAPLRPLKPGEQRRPRPIKPEDIRPQHFLLYRISDRRVVAEAVGFLHQWMGPDQRRLIRQGETYRILSSALMGRR